MILRFYRCEVCGKTAAVLSDNGVPTYCCGRPMRPLIYDFVDESDESKSAFPEADNTVDVRWGSILHPMTDSSGVTRMGLRTVYGLTLRNLYPGSKPENIFFIQPIDSTESVYAFCNLDGFGSFDKEASIMK